MNLETEKRVMRLPLGDIQDDPRNSNRFNGERFEKVKAHIKATGRYPIIIVRELPESSRYFNRKKPKPQYMALDGHHRKKILTANGAEYAEVESWGEMTDEAAGAYLLSLNTNRGDDDPLARAALVADVVPLTPVEDLALITPEDERGLQELLTLRQEHLNLEVETPSDPVKDDDKETAIAVRGVLYPAQFKSWWMALGHIMAGLEGQNKTGRAMEFMALDYLSGIEPAERDALERRYLQEVEGAPASAPASAAADKSEGEDEFPEDADLN